MSIFKISLVALIGSLYFNYLPAQKISHQVNFLNFGYDFNYQINSKLNFEAGPNLGFSYGNPTIPNRVKPFYFWLEPNFQIRLNYNLIDIGKNSLNGISAGMMYRQTLFKLFDPNLEYFTITNPESTLFSYLRFRQYLSERLSYELESGYGVYRFIEMPSIGFGWSYMAIRLKYNL